MKKKMIALISGGIGGIVGTFAVAYKNSIKLEEIEKKCNKYRSYYNILNKMLYLKKMGIYIDDYLEEKGIKI